MAFAPKARLVIGIWNSASTFSGAIEDVHWELTMRRGDYSTDRQGRQVAETDVILEY
jgi:hypothetical protein